MVKHRPHGSISKFVNAYLSNQIHLLVLWNLSKEELITKNLDNSGGASGKNYAIFHIILKLIIVV